MTRQAISQSGQTAPASEIQVDASVEGEAMSQDYGVYTGYFECATPATWTEHVHDTHELLWGARGVLTVEAGGGFFAVPATLGLWIPAGVVHAVKSTQGTDFYCSHISTQLAPQLAPQLTSRTVAVTVPTAAQELLRHMSNFDMDDSIRKRSEQVVLGLLDVVDARPMLLPMPSDPRLGLIARALLDDPALDRSLEEWSVHVSISPQLVPPLPQGNGDDVCPVAHPRPGAGCPGFTGRRLPGFLGQQEGGLQQPERLRAGVPKGDGAHSRLVRVLA
jgi:quercetin dioxygenase-like cupin family protein